MNNKNRNSLNVDCVLALSAISKYHIYVSSSICAPVLNKHSIERTLVAMTTQNLFTSAISFFFTTAVMTIFYDLSRI